MPSIAPSPNGQLSIRRNGVAEDTKSTLVHDTHLILSAVGVERGGNWISRTVRDFLAAPVAGIPFPIFLMARVELNEAQRRRLAENADLRYLLSYADPTGETAVRNVMRERARLSGARA